MVIAMDRVPSQPVQDPPNLVRADSFSLDRLLSHIDPGTAEESEDFVRLIYDQRHIDLPSSQPTTLPAERKVDRKADEQPLEEPDRGYQRQAHHQHPRRQPVARNREPDAAASPDYAATST